MASLVLLNSVAHALVKMCTKGSLIAVYRKATDTGVRANLSSDEERRTFVTVSEVSDTARCIETIQRSICPYILDDYSGAVAQLISQRVAVSLGT